MNSKEMQKVINRCVNSCSKKDLAFKLYVKNAIRNIIDSNDSWQHWRNSSWMEHFPKGDLEMDHIEDLFLKQWDIQFQLDQIEEKTNDEDKNYMADITSYLKEKTK